MSQREFRADRLDVHAFARDGADLNGELALATLPRLIDSLHDADSLAHPPRVYWRARGRSVTRRGGAFETWLDLQVRLDAPLTCQACLERVAVPIVVDRSFRFVADEAQAAEMDADSEDDVLVGQRDFNLVELIEDELLLALPLVPRHEACPTPLTLPETAVEPVEAAVEPDAQAHPFAVLRGQGRPRTH